MLASLLYLSRDSERTPLGSITPDREEYVYFPFQKKIRHARWILWAPGCAEYGPTILVDVFSCPLIPAGPRPVLGYYTTSLIATPGRSVRRAGAAGLRRESEDRGQLRRMRL